MQSDNSKINMIFKDILFSEREIKIIEKVFERVHHKKGEMILLAGDTVHEQYYILSGCLRSFYIDPSGKEYTVQFGVRDWWMSDYTAFFSKTKAVLNIEVIQDAVMYKFRKKDKEYLYSEIPKIETFFRIKLEKAFAAFQKRIIAGLSQTATERYINFMNTYPNIERQVKNYHIASYLGITTESLSRIRKELITH
ncbi:Crp/Fnr family transcriptional regulator [Psychroserpens sp. BH13MA-6]